MKKLILSLLLLCFNALLHAQKTAESNNITSDQKARLMSIINEIDGKLKPAIAADTKLQSQMQGELKTIAAIKDVKQRSSAITTYQQKYKATYGALLKKAGVDMAKYIKELNTTFPGYQFMLSGDFAIIGKAKAIPPLPSQPAGPVTTEIKNFTTDRSIGCGGIGGGGVTFTANSVKVSGFATVAGGCNNSGEMIAKFDVPKVSSASLALKHVLKANAFAVGVLGTGITMSSCYISLTDARSIHVMAAAPILWAAYEEDELNETITVPAQVNASKTLGYYARVSTVSVLPSEGNGDANITSISIKLTTQP